MSDPAATVRGLLADIERAEAAFDAACGRVAEQSDARLQDAGRQQEALRQAGQGLRSRAEQAEQAAALLRDEREVIRKALRAVTPSSDGAPGLERDGDVR
jgi:hypothetical protein